MYQIEIVRLCAIWDGIDLDQENIPTVVALQILEQACGKS
jgi:hypothetical protein